jgi:hypothetical protein
MCTGDHGPETKADEVLMVLQTDAVACPWTVMVHSHHTLLADAAVMGTGRLQVVALIAVPEIPERARSVGHVKSLLELLIWIILKKCRC